MEFNQLHLITASLLIGGVGVLYLFFKGKNRKFLCAAALDDLKINIVETVTDCKVVVAELQRRCKTYRAIGFDCEWVTEHGKRRPVALLQLSTHDGYCGLFRLSQLKNIPSSLKNLLEDHTIYKVGVGPVSDARYLHADYSIVLKSTLDLRHIAMLCGRHPGGLAALSKSILNITLDKSWRIRCSNWDAEMLSDRQIQYAAADAYVAVKIFVYLIKELSTGNVWAAQDGAGKEDIWNHLDDLCWGYADVNFKASSGIPQSETCSSKANKKNTVFKNRYPNAIRQKPLYHNCFLEAPDGETLCTCDNKKAEWYVSKKLADVVKSEPFTVRLRFEPSGRSVGDVGRYYKLVKENKCVVCGATNSYIRKNVVPREYRKYFPEIMKDHSSHDVVLLCVGCHQRSNMADQIVRERLANTCSAPLASKDSNKYVEDVTCKKIRSAARALLQKQSKHVIPEARRKDLEDFLLNYYEVEELTDTTLKEAAEMHVVVENADYESHGMKVVEYYLEREGLLRLEEVWREHFLSTMRPKYLPELWSIKHNEERLRIKLQEGRLSVEELKSIGVTNLL